MRISDSREMIRFETESHEIFGSAGWPPKTPTTGRPTIRTARVVLDMSQAAVKKMIADARERGYITYDQLNPVLPPDQVSSEQIEDVMSMLSEMGINIIEDDEAEDEDEQGLDRSGRSPNDARSRRFDDRNRKTRPHRRSGAHVSARNGLGRTAVARRRNRHRQADRGRPQHDDRRALRKPADLPGHHDLARRTSRRKTFCCAT